MNAIAPVASVPPLSAIQTSKQPGQPAPSATKQRQAFQNTVGSLFYGEMIKALRSGVGKPAYLHGGRAEEMFQGQMDQEIASALAKSHGARFIEELYQRFLVDHPEGTAPQSSELSALVQSVNSASTVESAQAAAWARPSTSVSRMTTGAGVIPALNRK